MSRFHPQRSSLRFAILAAALATAPALPVWAQNAPKPVETKPAAANDPQTTLLGQFEDWGAYKATPGGKLTCFAVAKPVSAVTEPPGRSRDASYMFVSSRPAEKVRNEISTIVGYPQKAGAPATATIGTATFSMYPQSDGAWIRNAGDEAKMVEAMRRGADLVIKSESARGTKTTDTYSLKGFGEALSKIAAECK